MDSITLENFRCFREKQTARLAPLTLLVGENSTGKTSFLAMVRALRDLALGQKVPDFKQEPYDLGSFDEIAHYRGGKAGRADEFLGAFTHPKAFPRSERNRSASFAATFRKRGPGPVPIRQRVERDLRVKRGPTTWVAFDGSNAPTVEVSFGTSNGSWKRCHTNFALNSDEDYLLPWYVFEHGSGEDQWTPTVGSALPSEQDILQVRRVSRAFYTRARFGQSPSFASAPVRSRPRRTYDPNRPTPDPEGMYIPMLYADMYFQKSAEWKELKTALESFGHDAGLFDEIVVRPLGKRGTEPFQLQVRKLGQKVKGPLRNLIDVGYGVSQVLPVVTELLRSDSKAVHLLQQPEVHLHPSAQAALGSLFCRIAGLEAPTDR